MINWNKYPYTDFHELNLDWIIEEIKKLSVNLADFVKLNTIKYADPIIWNITTQYEANTVVVDGQTGNAYISTVPVPAGVIINDTEYWTSIFNYENRIHPIEDAINTEIEERAQADDALQSEIDAQATALSNETTERTNSDSVISAALQNEIDARLADVSDIRAELLDNERTLQHIISHTNLADHSSFLTVGAYGCNYTTINGAIENAVQYCTPTERVAILVMPGTYNEQITLNPNPGIDFYGFGMPRIESDTPYPASPFFICGKTTIDGFYIFNTNSGNYAMHVEWQNARDDERSEMYVKNCIFVSTGNSAVGVGMGKGSVVRFYNCSFFAASANPGVYALYIHNYPDNALGQVAEFYNCDFHASGGNDRTIGFDNARAIQGNPGTSSLGFIFNNCTLQSDKKKITFRSTASETLTYLPKAGEVYLSANSDGNNASVLNYNDALPVITAINTEVIQIGWHPFVIPVKNASDYNWTVSDAASLDTGYDITSNVQIDSTFESTINGRINNIDTIHGFRSTLTGIPK